MARLRAPGLVAGLAAVVWLAFGRVGFANYDALYALVWGRELGHGASPSFDVSLAPTPHPLANLAGLALAPFGARFGEDVLVVVGFLALGAIGWLLFELGRVWFGLGAGIAAAALFLTREPVLSYGVRAYVDLPYLALVLGALLVEARAPARRPRLVLALLVVAGLLRPEAWLFSAAYVVWRREWRLAWLAAAGPVLWFASDLVATGDPLHSLTGTRDNTETLGRVTGLRHVPATLPRRVGEVVREPGLLAAAGGGLLALVVARTRERAVVAAGAGVVAVGAFCVLATAGLPIITRYSFVVSAVLAVFAGAGLFGWTRLERGDPWRGRWIAFSALAAVVLALFVPSQVSRLRSTQHALARQDAIQADLWRLRGVGACPGPIGVPNHRLVPLLALRSGGDPARIVLGGRPASFVAPASPAIARAFILDPRDPVPVVRGAPPGLRPVAANGSWRLLARCRGDHR